MTDETTTTTTTQPVTTSDATATALQSLQADNANLARQLTAAQSGQAAALRERDALKTSVDELAPKAKLADELQVKVDGFVNAGRETKLVEALQAKFPGAEPLAIRGVLGQLHDTKRLNKFAEDTAATLAAALPIITAEATSLTRPPTGASGSSLVSPAATKPGYRGPFAKS